MGLCPSSSSEGLGVCSACWNDVEETTLEKKSGPKKIRPLLADLEQDFHEHAGADKVLNRDELKKVWLKSAKRHQGKLSPEDKELIRIHADEIFDRIDVDKSGLINSEEFLTHVLGHDDSNAKVIREQLNQSLQKDPAKMQELFRMFKSWDKNGDGFITAEELEETLKDLVAFSRGTPKEKQDITLLKKIKDDIFKEADCNGDGKVDLWEVMAYMMGRKKQPVEILLYDISAGHSNWMGPMLLGKKIEMVHSAVLVYGSEFWYGGNIFKSEAPCEKQFGKPLTTPWDIQLPMSEVRPDLPVVKVGYTFVRHDEFSNFLINKLRPKYAGIEKYDLLTHNCCNFSDEVVTFLTGSGLPDKILEIQKIALTPTIKALRPYLNKYLGGFGDANPENRFEDDGDHEAAPDALKQMLGDGSSCFVEIDGIEIVARIVSQTDDGATVKYFDMNTNEIKTTTVSKSALTQATK